MENTDAFSKSVNDQKSLRKIRTARSLRSINSGVKQGFNTLLRKVQPSPEIRDSYILLRNKRTGEVVMAGDPRDETYTSPSWELALESDYYPYHFKSPFAAYLIPKDIQEGEEVILLDVIEDYIGVHGPGGETYRLHTCTAIWRGNDLEIKYDPETNVEYWVG